MIDAGVVLPGPLVLASGSPRRHELLTAAGFEFDRQADRLTDDGGDGRPADRPRTELLDDGREQPPVHVIEAQGVHFEHPQGLVRHRGGDVAVGPDLGEVANPPQQPVGDARGSPGPSSDLIGGLVLDLDTQLPELLLHVGDRGLQIPVFALDIGFC